MSRKLHDGVDATCKCFRLETVRGLDLPREWRHSLTFGILGLKPLTEPDMPAHVTIRLYLEGDLEPDLAACELATRNTDQP